MTTRTRKTSATPAPAGTPAKRAAAKKTPAARTPRKKTTTGKKTQTRLSLVKPRKPLPVRHPNLMTDIQGHATLAARIAGITTPHIRQWVDHHDGTATRRLLDGTLHYTHTTRTLAWQATCLMGAVHTYPIPTPAAAAAARVLAARCTQPHHDLSTIPPLTGDELAALGLLHTPTWARPDLLGDQITETIPVPLPDRPARVLADQLTHSGAGATDTQPLSAQEIADGLTARADHEQMKEHPQP